MLMYRYGKAIKRHNFNVLLAIALLVLAVVAGIYFLFIKNSPKTTISNNKSTTTNISSNNQASVTINEPLFTLTLPGQWKETARDSDPHYQSIQWNFVSKKAAGRWVRIYTDTIPANFALNYLQPVTAVNDGLSPGQPSDNCVTFTQGATPGTNRDVSVPNSQAALPARWQGVSFMCDNSHVSHQVAGTGSTEGKNTLTVSGSARGPHKYFFVYEDDAYHPDYSVFMNVLESFKAK